MANASLISRILHALTDYEAGRMSLQQIEKCVESNMQGLERIGLREIHESRRLTYRLEFADFSVGEDIADAELVPAVLADFRRFLRSLPDGSTAEPDVTTGSGGTVTP